MEKVSLIDNYGRTQLFKRAVLNNLDYWQNQLKIGFSDAASIDLERNSIIRAITFALDLEGLGWPAARQLIETFSPYMERRGHWEMWKSVLEQATATAERGGDALGQVSMLVLMARLSQRQGRYAATVANYRRVIRLAQQTGDFENVGRACSNLGFLYAESGQWWRSEILCCRALVIFQELAYIHGQAHTESHLGSLYTRQGRWLLAQQHFERACTLWQEMADDHSLMRGFINLGGLYCDSEQPDAALANLQKALHLAKMTGEEAEIGAIYNNMGIAYRLLGDAAQAESFARQAETIFRQFNNLAGIALARDNLGLASLAQNRWDTATAHLQAAYDDWHKLGHKRGEVRNLVYQVQAALAQDNQRQATCRLKEAEQRMKDYDLDEQDAYWQPLLDKCRRRLAG